MMFPDAEPITGYGDFSSVDPFEVDNYDVIKRVVQCLQDHGIDARTIPPGDGISYEAVPEEQLARAEEISDGCFNGLNLQPARPLDEAQLTLVYEYGLAVAECLEEQGLSVNEPPSLETFLAGQGQASWDPYALLSDAEVTRAQTVCPQQPPGGYGAWRPGDPIG